MPTSYTPILKLALPANGELSGTWGTVVNDNVTSMIEEAIAGQASVSSWSANAATITTANGTTSAGRAMMLDLSGTLTAAGTLTVPTANKMFIVKNGTTGGFAVTVKMATGTGVSVPNGTTMIVYADGTNVIRAAGDVDLNSAQTLTNKTLNLANNTVTGTLPVANGGTGTTTSTGSGSVVLSTSPSLTSPVLGTPTSGTLTNCTFPTLNQNTTGSAASVSGASSNGYGTRTVSTSAPSGGSNGDIWYRVS